MVPVLDSNKEPLMPCSEKRARKLMERGDAKPYWCKGIFCIILQREPSGRNAQQIVVGIDPGSKWEGFTVKSESHTLLNVQTSSRTDVERKMETRSNLRRDRRGRLRGRKCRFNRKRRKGWVPPSTKSRWDHKISLINWFRKMFQISMVAIEDIAAVTRKGCRKWNKNFSPLEVGKNYFRAWVDGEGLELYEYKGYNTADLRKSNGLKKNSEKSKQDFYTHCVDSWCIANDVIGGHLGPENVKTVFLKPLVFFRRQLHVQNPVKGGNRKNYGSNRSLGISRGTLVRHLKRGLALVGGTSKGRVSLHRLEDGKRLCQNAKIEDLRILTKLRFNIN